MHDETLRAGAEAAGEGYFQSAHGGSWARADSRRQRRLSWSRSWSPDAAAASRGRLISAQWDPWRDARFRARLREDSALAKLRRIDDQFFTRVGPSDTI